MKYDKEISIGENNINSNIKVESSIIDNNLFLYIYLLLNLPIEVNYNTILSNFKLIFLSNNNQVVETTIGNLIEIGIESEYLKTNGLRVSGILIPPSADSINILGRLYLDNNKFYIVNKTIPLLDNNTTFINTYFEST